jgi:hypothetical protein
MWSSSAGLNADNLTLLIPWRLAFWQNRGVSKGSSSHRLRLPRGSGASTYWLVTMADPAYHPNRATVRANETFGQITHRARCGMLETLAGAPLVSSGQSPTEG